MNRKLKVLTVAFIIYMTVTVTALATYPIWSNEIPVTTQDYTFTLVGTPTGCEIEFSGVLQLGATPIQGKTVTIYHSDGAGHSVGDYLITTVTAVDGSYTATYLEPSPDTRYYIATVNVP